MIAAQEAPVAKRGRYGEDSDMSDTRSVIAAIVWLCFTGLVIQMFVKYVDMPPLLAMVAGAFVSVGAMFAFLMSADWILRRRRVNNNDQISK